MDVREVGNFPRSAASSFVVLGPYPAEERLLGNLPSSDFLAAQQGSRLAFHVAVDRTTLLVGPPVSNKRVKSYIDEQECTEEIVSRIDSHSPVCFTTTLPMAQASAPVEAPSARDCERLTKLSGCKPTIFRLDAETFVLPAPVPVKVALDSSMQGRGAVRVSATQSSDAVKRLERRIQAALDNIRAATSLQSPGVPEHSVRIQQEIAEVDEMLTQLRHLRQQSQNVEHQDGDDAAHVQSLLDNALNHDDSNSADDESMLEEGDVDEEEADEDDDEEEDEFTNHDNIQFDATLSDQAHSHW